MSDPKIQKTQNIKVSLVNEYWLKKLSGPLSVVSLPFLQGLKDETISIPRVLPVKLPFPEQLTQQLKKIAKHSAIGQFILCLGALNIVLHKYTGIEDVLVGTLPPNITAREENIFFCRVAVPSDATVKEVLAETNQQIVDAINYAEFSFASILAELQQKNNNSVPDIFKVLLVYGAPPAQNKFLQKFDLLLSLAEENQQLVLTIAFPSFPAAAEMVATFAKNTLHLLHGMLASTASQIASLDVVNDEEKKYLLYALNNTAATYPADKTIPQLFEAQAERTPDHIALIGQKNDGTQLTYAQLNEKSTQLAHVLIKEGILPDTIVAIILERSIEMIIGILGILKSGGAYLPIDPHYPEERKQFILCDSAAKLQLTAQFIQESTPHTPVTHVTPIIPILPITPVTHVTPTNLAYIIYTSGTTGNPKGSAIEHRSLVNRLHWMQKQYPLSSDDTILQKTTFTFDVSVWELLWWSIVGAKVCMLIPGGEKDPAIITQSIDRFRITTMHFVPSMLSVFLDWLKSTNTIPPVRRLSSLKQVIASGEALLSAQVELFTTLLHGENGTLLTNLYGPTEATIDVSYFNCTDGLPRDIIPIGKPIDNICLYILDKNGRFLPAGIAGELHIAGIGLARGYLNRPQLTHDKFIPLSLTPTESTRGYKTGDLARWLPDGNIEFLGRIDFQVKIRGFRIELGEIENQLLKHPDIRESVVLLKEDSGGDKNLIAYFAANVELFGTELREYLLTFLPEYMIPAYFVQLQKIPLTPNGKVDRAALPTPGVNLETYIAPRTPLETTLAELWAHILKMEKVGVTDKYFDLGGDSIKAIRLVSQINERLKTAIGMVDLYTHRTIASLAEKMALNPAVIDQTNQERIIADIQALKERITQDIQVGENIADIYPMTDIEKGIAFYYLKHSGAGVYHDQFVYTLRYPDFDLPRMEKVLALMMAKHAILRTSFNMGDYDQPVNLVYKHLPLPLEYVDLSQQETTQQQEFILACKQADRKKPFNVSHPPLWRMTFFSLAKDHILVLFIFHHAILDGWSVASLITEINNLYLKLEFEPSFQPEPLDCSYKDAVISEIVEKQRAQAVTFWKKELADYNRLDIFETVKSDVIAETMKSIRYDLGAELLEKLKTAAKNNNTSLKNIIFAAYIYLMNILSNEADVVVGNVSNNRPVKPDGDKVLGCFLNTVPVRVLVPQGKSWREFICLIEEKMLELRHYERMPLFEIARVIGEKSKDKNPIFDTLLNYRDFHVVKDILIGPIKPVAEAKPILTIPRSEDTNTLFDFEVDVTRDRLLLEPKFRALVMDSRTVEKSCLYFERIILQFINHPDALMSKNAIIPDAEKLQLLYEYNRTETPYASHKTMHQLFEEQVLRTPERVAVIDKDGIYQWTYQQLNSRANQLAHLLRKQGLTPAGLVAVMMDRSIHAVMALLGILKAGGAYVPMEPYLPDERIRKITESLAIQSILTNEAQLLKVGRIVQTLPLLAHVFCLDFLDPSASELCTGKELFGPQDIKREAVDNLPPTSKSEDISYIIFTSGSTGTPKGVVETHRPVINVIEWVNKTFHVGYPDKLLFVASLSFDLSVYDIFGILATGACLRVVAAEDIKNPSTLLHIIMTEAITFWDSAPAALQQLVPFFHEVATYPHPSVLRLVFLSGDWIPVTMPDALRDAFTGVKVISLGGATEATVWSNYYPIDIVDPSWPSIPYGNPIQNARYYILDAHLEVCPFRVPGDLFIGGQCLALEYINDAQLSAYKFIPNPYVPGEKMYRTGDIARWLEEGYMQFLGRKDHQVKIRGYRIELGEIESQLLNHPAINDGIVLDRVDGSGNKYLCAYYVCKSGAAILDKEELKEHLSRELPEYMIPAYFIPIEKVPLTPNGKLDRNALPEPEVRGDSASVYVAPENETQEKLLSIWAHVLGLPAESIGIDADFFELGGHSLNATMVISRIHKELNVKVPLAEIFNSPTLRDLSSTVKSLSSQLYDAIEPAEKKEYYPLSSAQRRLYITHHRDTESLSYHIHHIFYLQGTLKQATFENAFMQLIKRHESFRTSFDLVAQQPVQRIHDDVEFRVQHFSIPEDAWAKFSRPFQLSRAPLLRVGLTAMENDKYLVLIDMHHIITDFVSTQILMNDFVTFYRGEPEDQKKPLEIQYKDYAKWQNDMYESPAMKSQEQYWLNKFADGLPILNLPTDYSRPPIQRFEGNVIKDKIDETLTAKLNEFALRHGVTRYMVLMAVFSILLAKYSNQDDIIFGSPIAGRDRPDLEAIVGMFVNVLLMRNLIDTKKEFVDYLAAVKFNTLQAFNNQDYSIDLLAEKLQIKRQPGRNPLYEVIFALTIPENANQHLPDLKITPFAYPDETIKTDLRFGVVDFHDKIEINLTYSTTLFKCETATEMLRNYKDILIQVLNQEKMKIEDITLSYALGNVKSNIFLEEDDEEFNF